MNKSTKISIYVHIVFVFLVLYIDFIVFNEVILLIFIIILFSFFYPIPPFLKMFINYFDFKH
jgi:hypothetical protein